MKKVLSSLLFFVMLFSMAVTASAVSLEPSNIQETTTFNLEVLDPDLNFFDAIKQYPAITESYYIIELSEEEAMEAVESGERIFYAGDNNPSAVKILSSLNHRISSSTNQSEIAKDVQKETTITSSNSLYGAAIPYRSVDSPYVNCYGYAIGIDDYISPGYYAGEQLREHFGLQNVVDFVIDDFVAMEGGARVISDNTDKVNPWEWRIATRTGSGIYSNGETFYWLFDFHFWVQTNLGAWCHKPGGYPSVYLGYVAPHNESWNLGDIKNFYDSDTVYLAVYSNPIYN